MQLTVHPIEGVYCAALDAGGNPKSSLAPGLKSASAPRPAAESELRMGASERAPLRGVGLPTRRTDMRLFITVCVALLLTSTHSSNAACRDDLKELKPRVERIKFSDKDRYDVANRWLDAAEKAEPRDEAACQNYYIRALRALKEPMDAVTKNAAPPGGGTGSSVAPVGPVTQAPGGPAPPKFTSPPAGGPAAQPKK